MSDLPKVIWTSPDGETRAVLRAVRNAELSKAVVDIEGRSSNAMHEPTWVGADLGFRELVDQMAEIVADLSGVKWREAKA